MKLLAGVLLALTLPGQAASPKSARVQAPASLQRRPVSALPLRAAVAAAAPAPASPEAKKKAKETVDAVFAELGQPRRSSDDVLRDAFDGTFKKGSIEERFAAPPGPIDVNAIRTAPGRKLSKSERRKLEKDIKDIRRLQKLLRSDKTRRVLAVHEGIDASGKDGSIKGVFKGLDPHAARVVSFKKPTDEEVKHHYLWRSAKALPGKAEFVAFNRSYYQDYIVPLSMPEMYEKIWGKLTPEQIQQRIAEINAFERRLFDEGAVILKFFMHVSKAEQKRRLEDRRDNAEKKHKFSEDDLITRRRWKHVMKAFSQMIEGTNTPYAPWFIVPADDKEFRDYVIGRITKRALKRLRLRWAPGPPGSDKIVIPD